MSVTGATGGPAGTGGQGGPLPPELYNEDVTCALCGKKFTVTKVRMSRLRVAGRDTDFNVTYEGLDPNYYTVWVCPHCGYAAPESAFTELNQAQKEALLAWLGGRKPTVDFSGVRTWDTAMAAFKLAIFQAQKRGARPSVVAGLCLRAAWLCRAAGDATEAHFLKAALDNYIVAYDKEEFPIGKMTERGLQYLLGELYLRVGRPQEAVGWFARVVEDRSGEEPQIVNMAREGWHRAKEVLKGAG